MESMLNLCAVTKSHCCDYKSSYTLMVVYARLNIMALASKSKYKSKFIKHCLLFSIFTLYILIWAYFPDCCLENSKYCFCRKSNTRRLLKYSTYKCIELLLAKQKDMIPSNSLHTQLAMHPSSYPCFNSRHSVAFSGFFSTMVGSVMFNLSRHPKYWSLKNQQRFLS